MCRGSACRGSAYKGSAYEGSMYGGFVYGGSAYRGSTRSYVRGASVYIVFDTERRVERWVERRVEPPYVESLYIEPLYAEPLYIERSYIERCAERRIEPPYVCRVLYIVSYKASIYRVFSKERYIGPYYIDPLYYILRGRPLTPPFIKLYIGVYLLRYL